MPELLSDKTVEMLEDWPPYLAADAQAQGILDPLARELVRVDDTMNEIRTKMLPQNCSDEYRTAAMHERVLELPVEPAGKTLAERRALILAHYRRRYESGSSFWAEALTESFGTTDWSWHLGPGQLAITIKVATLGGTWTAQAVWQLARGLTPAHLDLYVQYGTGFIIEVSQVGVDTL